MWTREMEFEIRTQFYFKQSLTRNPTISVDPTAPPQLKAKKQWKDQLGYN